MGSARTYALRDARNGRRADLSGTGYSPSYVAEYNTVFDAERLRLDNEVMAAVMRDAAAKQARSRRG